MSRKPGRRTASVALVAAAIAFTLITAGVLSRPSRAQEPPDSDRAAVEQAKSLSRAFRSAAQKVLPTVVKVRTQTKPRPRGPGSGGPFGGSPLEEFFGQMPDVPTPGLGSGVIIDPSGIVLTNNHVVADADEIYVQLGDGREFEVTEKHTDERSDLAVLRIQPDASLPAAKLGDSEQLEIGDWVIAVGNPFELEQSVSAGIISAKGRTLDSVRRARFLQTDAAINPGNSGGPLVNLDGEVIGINTAIFTRTGVYQGIGFAIPIELVKWVTPQLIEEGRVARAYLGVVIGNLTPDEAKRLGAPPNSGVVVSMVGEGSPAAAADLREDDVILSYDGRPVRSSSDLQELVERSPAGSKHELRILRDTKPMTLEVAVEVMPEDFETAMSRSRFGRSGSTEFYQDPRLGLGVIELTRAWAARLGYRGVSGVLVLNVAPDTMAARAGIREGSVVVRVGDRVVASVAEFREAVEQQSLSEGITLEIQTPRGSETVTLRSAEGDANP
jgi:serine protease Do